MSIYTCIYMYDVIKAGCKHRMNFVFKNAYVHMCLSA